MQRGQAAIQPDSLAQLRESQVGRGPEAPADGLPVGVEDLGLASGAVVLRGDVADSAALLEELLDHAQGDAEALGDLVAGAFARVVGGKDAFTEVEGERCHPIPWHSQGGKDIKLFKML